MSTKDTKKTHHERDELLTSPEIELPNDSKLKLNVCFVSGAQHNC